jgi:hypothetical protein
MSDEAYQAPRRFFVEVDSLLSWLVHQGWSIKNQTHFQEMADKLYREARKIYSGPAMPGKPEIASDHPLPITQQLINHPTGPDGCYEVAGRSVALRWTPKSEECGGGQALAEICKCRNAEMASLICDALNANSGRQIFEKVTG